MDRLRGIGSFLLVIAVVFGVLRLLHLAIPLFYPAVRSGPFTPARISDVAEYAGFAPRVPYYRPESLGTGPPRIVVTRRPEPEVLIRWEGEYFLELVQRREPPIPSPVDAAWFTGHPETRWWREDGTLRALVNQENMRIGVETDMPWEEFERVVETLRTFR